MPVENGHDGNEKKYSEKLRGMIDQGETGDKVAVADPAAAPLGTDSEAVGHTPTSKEVEMAIKEEKKPVAYTAQGPEQFDQTYYAEASLTKKIAVFALTTLAILIVFGLIYAYWPLAGPR